MTQAQRQALSEIPRWAKALVAFAVVVGTAGGWLWGFAMLPVRVNADEQQMRTLQASLAAEQALIQPLPQRIAVIENSQNRTDTAVQQLSSQTQKIATGLASLTALVTYMEQQRGSAGGH